MKSINHSLLPAYQDRGVELCAHIISLIQASIQIEEEGRGDEELLRMKSTTQRM